MFAVALNPALIQSVVVEGLVNANGAHDKLGEKGRQLQQTNQFGEPALVCDVTCEAAVIKALKLNRINAQIVSEEHGDFHIGRGNAVTVFIDGIDGTHQYKNVAPSKGPRYATMVSVYRGTNPRYRDFVSAGMIEHPTRRMLTIVKGGPTEIAMIEKPFERQAVVTSTNTSVDPDDICYCDLYWEANRELYVSAFPELNLRYLKASAPYYFDLATGRAALVLECTRKKNLELACAYPLVTGAGGVVVDQNGAELGSKRLLKFGFASQDSEEEFLAVISACNQTVADWAIERLNQRR